MRELDPIRRLAPPVTPLGPDELARIRARALTRRRTRLPLTGLLAPVAVAAAVLLVVLVLPGADREVPATAGVHDDAPRLLLGDGWKVTRVDEWEAGRGETTFTRADGQVLELTWAPATELAVSPGTEDGGHYELAFGTDDGFRAEVWKKPGAGYTAGWRDGDTTIVASGEAESAAGFAGLVQSLHDVGVDEWRRALPPSAVTPSERQAAVGAMLAGVELPPGFDTAPLTARAAETRDRYQLGAQIVGAVACAWIEIWADAKGFGDEAGARSAAQALGTSHTWPIVREMDAEGDYPEVLRQYADAVAGDGTVVGGKTMTVEESYRAALCP